MNIRTNLLIRVYLSFGIIFLFAFVILCELIKIQFVEGDKWKNMVKTASRTVEKTRAMSGYIFSDDRSIVAASVPIYRVRISPKFLRTNSAVNEHNLIKIISGLKRLFPQEARIPSADSHGLAETFTNKNLLILDDIDEMKFPLLLRNKDFFRAWSDGWLILEKKIKRVYPFGNYGEGIIGNQNDSIGGLSNIELNLYDFLRGVDASQLVETNAYGDKFYVPIGDTSRPINGRDIYTSLNINLQILVHNALAKELKTEPASNGFAAVMEVSTGEIKAIVNFRQIKPNVFIEPDNYIFEAVPPGNAFLLATYMILLNQNKIDTGTNVNVASRMRFSDGTMISDKPRLPMQMSVQNAFKSLSGVAAGKFVMDAYAKNPEVFLDQLNALSFNKGLNLPIANVGFPDFPNTHSIKWHGSSSLVNIACGNQISLPPLQLLMLYNAVANNGRMVAPIIIKQICRNQIPFISIKDRVVNSNICSTQTLNKIQKMLLTSISDGTEKKSIHENLFSIAGLISSSDNSGNSLADKSLKNNRTCFYGYFPANSPKYSIVIGIDASKSNSYANAAAVHRVLENVTNELFIEDPGMIRNPVQKNIH